MEYDLCRRMERSHRCAACHAPLVTIWAGTEHRLVCGKDKRHQGYERIPSLTELWRAGHEVGPAADKLEKKYGGRPMTNQALTTMTEGQMLQRIDKAKFPQELKSEEKRLLAAVAIAYGLDPLMRELTIYQGQPYVSIDGRYRKAQESNLLDGVASRPATEQERTEWSIPLGDYFIRAEVWHKGSSHPFVGWGRVRESETLGGKGFKPVETNPQRMAEKRAEAQALRKAFHIPLPSAEDIGAEETALPFNVNGATGEIIQGEAKVSEPPVPQAQVQTGSAKSKAENPPDNGTPITDRQLKAIYQLGSLLKWPQGELNKQCEGYGAPNPDNLTGAQAEQMIEYLNKQLAAQKGQRA